MNISCLGFQSGVFFSGILASLVLSSPMKTLAGDRGPEMEGYLMKDSRDRGGWEEIRFCDGFAFVGGWLEWEKMSRNGYILLENVSLVLCYRFHMDSSSSTSTNADSLPRPINRRQNRGQSVTTQRRASHEDETQNPTIRLQNARIGDDNAMAAKIQVLEGQQANMKMMIVCLTTVVFCLLFFSVLK
ncbi:hypothetical protein RHMOL_Rhmol02G0150800 [Rhododendron molle]|uniref:Uncharacterized protein n=1 Tax=Rhododendron molle TaxID=49168 RepID=A0ACC0PRM2_RHOML|nr:hypothetical protein RHMOL_Rhmol02G0150800 [Rhododendron molle]